MDQEEKKQLSFFELEQEVLGWWLENRILDKSIEQRPDNKLKTFYDGPITANGEPHHGHMLTFAMKDIIPRYWTMRGYKVSRSLGWDCQGIPVEYEVEKKLGFTEKKDIEEYGIEKFNALCRESVRTFQGDIVELEQLMGRLTNHDEEYMTMDRDYIESIWWSLSELYNKGLLYEGFKVVPYSTRAGTTLSNAEVALGGYKNIVDPAITVKFKLTDESDTFVLAWTTTPWTIPGNLALAVGKDVKYAKVEDSEGIKYILAQNLIENVFADKAVDVIEELTASDLEGRSYLPPFEYFKDHTNSHKILLGDHVTDDSGTGIVHLAPYGVEDNDIFVRENIESFDYLDDQGDFTNQIPDYSGINYRDANNKIISDLEELNLLFSKEDYPHDIAMCWRTKTPLIYKPIVSWYIKVSSMRKELMENNDQISWVPEHAKEGRFGNWLSEIKDWGISRSRYWGTPIPVWKSQSGKTKLIGSYQELEELSGVKLEDPHRPFVDDVKFELDGEEYTRIPDVLDVWYDSGAMPFARLHYPFENQELFEEKFPADYISESVDQTRGWFYSLHAIGTTLFGSQAFNNVVMSGYVLDDEGVKLSKSKGNYTSPVPMIQKYGADTIRLNFFSTPITKGEDTTISENTLKIQKQETIIPLWNIFNYYKIYADKKDFAPDPEIIRKGIDLKKYSNPLDHWVISLLEQTNQEVIDYLEEFNISKATKTLKNTISDISKWYIRRSRDRFNDSQDLDTIEILYYSVGKLIGMMAPFTPFITEHIYRTIFVTDESPESVHLTDYPSPNNEVLESASKILSEMELVRKVCELGNSIRTSNGIKLRQPLSILNIELASGTTIEESNIEVIMGELNIKEVVIVDQLSRSDSMLINEDDSNLKIEIDSIITPELQVEGNFREITRLIQAQRKQSGLSIEDTANVKIKASEEFEKAVKEYLQEIKDTVGASELEFILDNEQDSKPEIVVTKI